MERVSSIFSRIVRLVPRSLFDRAAARRQGENHAAGMPCWSQFITMKFCHLFAGKYFQPRLSAIVAHHRYNDMLGSASYFRLNQSLNPQQP